MKIIKTAIPDVLIIEPEVFRDDRGFFFESFNKTVWQEATGIKADFVQDNHSRSVKNVLRGLHYQIRQPQGKLLRAAVGEVFDVAVDLRKSSSTFGKWIGLKLSAENKLQLWVPEGFAHGFLVLSDVAEVLYKTTDYYAPEYERSIIWNDPDIGIEWPLRNKPLLSKKDNSTSPFKDAELFE
ncbi:MAG: dTDP-4-dehydrorhamnose 3,5-epimerase [Thermodesulfobacteriota bacterium]|nr:dTDP-4-dehydrorhamnose 3,5-epimerase [Thermodesulfobacteriota bacterium]